MRAEELNLNLLKALDALLSEKSVTKAGAKLGLGQSGMSGALARLRIAFNDPILVRVGRNYELTAYALSLALPVHEILQGVQAVLEHRAFDPHVDSRHFSISASDYSTFLLLEPFVRGVLKTAPTVQISIQPATPESFRRVEIRDTDIVLWRPRLNSALASEVLVQDRWICAAWSKHPGIRSGLTLERYLELPHLRLGLEGIETEADLLADSFEPARVVRVMTATYSSIPFLLTGTKMLTVLPERLGLRFAAAAEITLVELPFATPPIELAMYWHPGFTEDSGHSWLRDQLREAATLP